MMLFISGNYDIVLADLFILELLEHWMDYCHIRSSILICHSFAKYVMSDYYDEIV